MDDVSLHSPVIRSSGPPASSDMGQYTYDDDEEGGYTPRRIWPADYSRAHRYAVRALPIRGAPAASPAPPALRAISPNMLALLTVVGLVVFTCSTASLVIVAMLMDSTRGQVSAAAAQIAEVRDTLGQNQTQLARLVALMEAWLQARGANATAGRY